MPLRFRSDDKPVVEFDPRLELSPFTLFRRLNEGKPLTLVDVRSEPRGMTLQGARPLPSPHWVPPAGQDVLLFDDDGIEAVTAAQDLQARGHQAVRALFGGLQLYEFSLDPEVVGQQTFLVLLDENPD